MGRHRIGIGRQRVRRGRRQYGPAWDARAGGGRPGAARLPADRVAAASPSGPAPSGVGQSRGEQAGTSPCLGQDQGKHPGRRHDDPGVQRRPAERLGGGRGHHHRAGAPLREPPSRAVPVRAAPAQLRAPPCVSLDRDHVWRPGCCVYSSAHRAPRIGSRTAAATSTAFLLAVDRLAGLQHG